MVFKDKRFTEDINYKKNSQRQLRDVSQVCNRLCPPDDWRKEIYSMKLDLTLRETMNMCGEISSMHDTPHLYYSVIVQSVSYTHL